METDGESTDINGESTESRRVRRRGLASCWFLLLPPLPLSIWDFNFP